MNHTVYNLALDERLKFDLQEQSRCFHLPKLEQERFSRNKDVHAVLVMLSIMGAVASCAGGDWAGVFTLPFVAFWAGGLVHASASTCRSQTLHVTLSTLAGWAVCGVIFALAAM